MSDVKKIVTESLIGMISGVTGLVPPDDGSIPDFIQAPIDRAAYRISLLITAKDARIAELERVLHESSQYLDGNKLNQIASGSKLHCMMRGVVSGMHPATPSEDGRRVLEGWRLANELKKQFPLLDDNGLCEVEHHCEWSIQQDRKRLHALLDAQPARQVGEYLPDGISVASKDAEIARLRDAADKGDAARLQCVGMEMEISELRALLAND